MKLYCCTGTMFFGLLTKNRNDCHGRESSAAPPDYFPFLLLNKVFLYLNRKSKDRWFSLCTDCKALKDKFVILGYINEINLI